MYHDTNNMLFAHVHNHTHTACSEVHTETVFSRLSFCSCDDECGDMISPDLSEEITQHLVHMSPI